MFCSIFCPKIVHILFGYVNRIYLAINFYRAGHMYAIMLTVFISGLLVKKKQHQKKQTGNLQKKTCLGELIVGIDVGYSLK